MKYPIKHIQELMALAWSKVVASDDAEYIADAVITASLTKDLRMDPVREATDDLRKALARKPTFSVPFDGGACRCLDFDGTTPFAFLKTIHDDLRDRSKAFGIASLAIRNTAGVHQLSTWVEPLARGGKHIALFLWNGGSFTVAPFGSKEPFFGTNPLAYAIPSDAEPIVCDMATSEVPFLSLMTAIRAGHDLDRRAGVDHAGKITSVARAIYDIDNDGPVRLLPMGLGYKGSALMLLIEVLTGALIGAKMGREATDSTFKPEEFGGWLIVWNIDAFGNSEAFRGRMGDLAKGIKTSERMDGIENIFLPGDRGHALKNERLKKGFLDIKDEVYRELCECAE